MRIKKRNWLFIVFGLWACSSQPNISEKQQVKSASDNREVANTTDTVAASISSNGESTLDEVYQGLIKSFIQAVKKGNRTQIASYFSFPLKRDYPVPAIANQKEFVERYDELFDAALIAEITQSDPMKDWSEVGWRGIMLHQGTLWMETGGKIIALNYQTAKERARKAQMIQIDKSSLYPTLVSFGAPVGELETAKFRVRIDELENGNYRYVSWPKNRLSSDEPDLVLTNGVLEISGSGGNHNYRFTNNEYTYICYIIVMGEGDAPPARLVIEKNGTEIYNAPATLKE